MPNYGFVSPGAQAAQSIEELLLQRAQLERQAQLDALTKTKQQEDLRIQGEDLALRRQREARIDSDTDAARKELGYEREFRRATTLVDNSIPKDQIDQATAEMLNRQGYEGAYNKVPGVVAQGPQRDEIEGVPIYDVSTGPETYAMRGGSKHLQAQEAATARATQAQEAIDARATAAKEAERAADERAAEHDKTLIALKGMQTAADSDAALALTPQGLDLAASVYARGGGFPPMGMGKAGAAARQAIINRAAQYNTTTGTFTGATAPPDPIAGKAGITANTQALSQLTKNGAAVGAFEDTVRKNGELLKTALGKIPGANLPRFLASRVRDVATQFGSEAMATFVVLRQSVQNEYARIINNPNLVGVLTDTARQEMEKLLSPDATVGQLKAALEALQAEAGNRRAGFAQERARVEKELRAPTGGAPTTDIKKVIEDARARLRQQQGGQ